MFPDGVSYLPRGSPGNLQKFSTTILRDFIRGTHPLTRALTSCLWCIFARAPMVMKYRGTLTRCSVSLICIKREQAWFSAEWFNLGIKAGCGNKRFVSLASEQHPFPLSLFLSLSTNRISQVCNLSPSSPLSVVSSLLFHRLVSCT